LLYYGLDINPGEAWKEEGTKCKKLFSVLHKLFVIYSSFSVMGSSPFVPQYALTVVVVLF